MNPVSQKQYIYKYTTNMDILQKPMNDDVHVHNRASSMKGLMEDRQLNESFERSPSMAAFLLENGNSMEMREYFAMRALMESMSDKNSQFTFSNGMAIPALGSKATGRLSLNSIYESTSDSIDFVQHVNETICDALGFDMSVSDELKLQENYDKYSRARNRRL